MNLLFVFMLTLSVVLPCFGSQASSVAEKILIEHPTDVKKVENNKIYLYESHIFPSSDGLFLVLDSGDEIQLPALCSDSQGCYLPVTELGSPDQASNFKPICPNCHRPYFLWCDYCAKNRK